MSIVRRRGQFMMILTGLVIAFFASMGGKAQAYRVDTGLPCFFKDSINITNGGYKDEKDNYHHGEEIYSTGEYGDFNFEIINGSFLEVEPHVRGCICRKKGSCARVCCDPNKQQCGGTLAGYFKDIETGEVTYQDDYRKEISVVFGEQNCQKYVLEPSDPYDNFTLLSTGSIMHADVEYDKEQYCLFHSHANSTTVKLCFVSEPRTLKFEIYPYGMLISVPFLVITFLVYGLIPDLRNLHGKNLMSYVICLAVAYISMAVVHLKTNQLATTLHCKWLGYIAYIAFVSSFFWLNVMCFDIWWTFRGVRGIARDLQKKKFLLYSLYGWGCPLMILTVVYLADHTDLVPEVYRPRMGVSTCFLSESKLTSFIYLYMIMILQLLFNITLFLFTAYQIRKLQQETKQMTKGGESRRFNKMEADKDRYPLVRFSLYLRLFIVMGVTWLAEVLSFALDLPDHYSYVTDILNSLHGFFIFFLFVWKPKIRQLIVKRYRNLRGLQPINTFRSSTMTTGTPAYSRQSTINGNQCVQMKPTKGTEKREVKPLTKGDEDPNTDRD